MTSMAAMPPAHTATRRANLELPPPRWRTSPPASFPSSPPSSSPSSSPSSWGERL